MRDIALETLLIFLLLGSAFGTVFGIGVALRARWCLRTNDSLSRWVSTRLLLRPLEVPRGTQRVFYRHHRLLGALLLLGSVYSVAVLAWLPDLRDLAVSLTRPGSPHAMEVYLRTGRVFLLAGNCAALVVSLVLLIRPSLLKGVEAWANRSVSLRPVSRFLETMNYAPDRLVHAYPVIAGVSIAIASMWVAAHLLVTLLTRF